MIYRFDTALFDSARFDSDPRVTFTSRMHADYRTTQRGKPWFRKQGELDGKYR